jgi:alpha-L-fucosidase
VNGGAITGTRAGPLTPRPWGVTTQKGDTVYVHLLDGVDASVVLPMLPRTVSRAFLLDGGAPVTVTRAPGALTLTLPRRTPDVPDQVVALVLAPR